MKIGMDSGAGVEPDPEPRNTKYHMRFVRVERLKPPFPGARAQYPSHLA